MRAKVTQQKRLRERAKQEKRQQKAERRALATERRGEKRQPAGGEDPDLAGIVPGPQPSPWGEFLPPGDDEDSESDETE
jgi:hypothetical protein